VNKLVGEELSRRGIPPELRERCPYSICFVREFEYAIQVMHEVGIDIVLKGLQRPDKLGWQMTGYLRAEFLKELKRTRALFPQDVKALMPPMPN
jgi:hypothetical protein